MFDLSKDPKGFARMTISGRVDADEMRDGLEAFVQMVDASEKTDFLYTITDFQWPPLEAWGVEVGYIPMLMERLGRVGKVAVVADASWLRIAAEIEGKLIPGLEIESFALGEEEAAEKWLLEAA